ncbi:MAG TPA: hypothetical protein VJ770_16430 [Stellaceae bacterium]|nr:hypothetical protein [Stellaceae bacterium]
MTGLAGLVLVLFAGLPAAARPTADCRPTPLALWGDGRHDDTAALNAWFRGESVVWADTGKPVGAAIVDRAFKLSAAIYVPSGTGRTITHFRFVWPWTHEEVTGGTIAAGTNPDLPVAESGIRKTGGDPSEGISYRAPAAPRPAYLSPGACLVS